MSALSVDERSHRAAFNNIQVPTLQRKTVVPEITDRESKFHFAVEPSFHCVLIIRVDASHGARLQRPQMRIDNLLREFCLVVVPARLGIHSPTHDYDKKKGGRGRKPVPKEGRGGRNPRKGAETEIHANPPT